MPTTDTEKTATVPKPEPKNNFKANYDVIQELLEAVKKLKEEREKKPEVRDEGLEKIKQLFNM